MNTVLKKSRIAIAIFIASAIATSAYSQESSILEEVFVTATKRSESVQKVSISVSALSGNQLDALGLSDM